VRYEQPIHEAFTRLGFTPRDHQAERVDRVVSAFLDDKAKNVVLSAPTGTGKSIIGTVVGEVLHSIRYPDTKANATFLLSATNVLLDQYFQTFGDRAENGFLLLKGAGNYECKALSTPEEPQTAEACAIPIFRKTGAQDLIDLYCGGCEYQVSRARKAGARHIITNYAFYFIDRMYSTTPMPRRTLTVFDEAHLLNDLFVEHNAIYVSEKRLNQFAEEVNEHLTLGHTDVFRNLKAVREALVRGKISDEDGSYLKWLQVLLDTYTAISEAAKQAAERSIRQPAKFIKLQRLSKKFYNLGCKIDDLFLFEYPHVFEHKPRDVKKGQAEDELSVKPIFVGDMFEALDNAEHNLLMSATVSEAYAKRTMTLPGDTIGIRLEPSFPRESKRMVFFKPQALNYSSMKQPETVKKLCATAWQIVDHHVKQGHRGIVLAPSFAVVESVAATLRGMSPSYRIFEHLRGEKLADVLADFKAYTAGPAVMLTPSGFEGIDLPGDLSRFQVIVKAPFASLGDKRIKVILDRYPDIYSLTTLMKIVQGAGRSVRSSEDHAVTYALDTGIQRLWTGKDNVWANEFQTSYTSNLNSTDAD